MDSYFALSAVSPRGRCPRGCPGSHCVLPVGITVHLTEELINIVSYVVVCVYAFKENKLFMFAFSNLVQFYLYKFMPNVKENNI